MNVKDRYLHKPIQKDLKEKMVFLAGPRQVGKTTFARELLGAEASCQYYNWDNTAQRRKALKGEWSPAEKLVILDEFHKHSKWKTWIKGQYDTYKDQYQFLLTGSARLDVYRRGGDSLQGRYHHYRLHPFSMAELNASPAKAEPMQPLAIPERADIKHFETLLEYGGFPEPMLRQDSTHLRRWQNERLERLFKEDIRDLTRIQDMGNLLTLADLLPEKVASILSINSLANDIQVNFRTMSHWLDVFEFFYYCFRLGSFQSKKIASVRKEKKLYLWDWALLKQTGPKLENLVASHLLKFCHYLHDAEGWQVTLHYLRDKTGREVDFLVCHENKPWFAVEVKAQDEALSKNLIYFKEKLGIPHCYQITLSNKNDFVKSQIRVLPVSQFLGALF